MAKPRMIDSWLEPDPELVALKLSDKADDLFRKLKRGYVVAGSHQIKNVKFGYYEKVNSHTLWSLVGKGLLEKVPQGGGFILRLTEKADRIHIA